MVGIVRDDIIKLETYVDAEFKYKEYIEVIAGCGGYCFLDQFERLLQDKGGKYLAKKMEDANLIKTDYFSNYKYVRLTPSALKYLYYRDYKKDFSDTPKNKIPIQNLKAKPSEKVLFTSVMYFELVLSQKLALKHNNRFFLKENHTSLLNSILKKDSNLLIKEYQKKLKAFEDEVKKLQFTINSMYEIWENMMKIKSQFADIKLEKTKQKDESLIKKEELFSFNKKNLDGEIDNIDRDLNILSAIEDINRSNMEKAYDIQLTLNAYKREIYEIKEEINLLKAGEDKYNANAERAINKLINMRDVSKVVCIPIENKLYFFSTFVKNHKSNYHSIINDTIWLLEELDIEFDEVELHLISIKDNSEQINKLFEKTKKNIYSDIKLICKYERLKELEKYFENSLDNINYIKDTDIEVFEKLREKLAAN